MTNLDKARWISLLVPAGLLGGAYVSQYGFGLFPCEMCWWQRYPHFAAIGLALLAFTIKPARWPVALAALAVGTGIAGCATSGRLSGIPRCQIRAVARFDHIVAIARADSVVAQAAA